MKPDKDEPRKYVDLDPSEWTSADKREPFFGPAAWPVLIMFLAGFPISAAATLLVTGELPYWLQRLLQ